MRHEVALQIGAVPYTGWQEVTISRGIEQMAGSFELVLTDKWSIDGAGLQIQPGQAARVAIDGSPVITGWIDDVSARHGPTEHTLAVRGRDVAGDLVDCAALHQTQEWAGRTLLQVAADLCRPFGIAVRAETGVGEPLKYKHKQPGETVYEALERTARYRGVLLVSDGLGSLVITRAGSHRAQRSLQYGVNIKSGQSMRSHRDRFSLYRILGQQRETDTLDAETASQTSATVNDSAIVRYRPMVIQSSDPIDHAAARERARWERSVRAGRGNEATVTVRGWMDGDAPWRPNTLVEARDPYLGLDGEYLVGTLAYRLTDREGEVTDLTLKPPQAFEVLPESEANPDGDAGLFNFGFGSAIRGDSEGAA